MLYSNQEDSQPQLFLLEFFCIDEAGRRAPLHTQISRAATADEAQRRAKALLTSFRFDDRLATVCILTDRKGKFVAEVGR
jgi:hypothetical protein